MKKLLISCSVTAALLGLLVVGFVNIGWLRDQYVFRSVTVQPAAAQIGDQLSLTSAGDFMYTVSRPEVQDAQAFNESCSDVAHEHSIVLGCYTRQRIYVFDVTDPRLQGIKEVTAAHELLHAVYERLSSGDREHINRLLEAQAKMITDPRLLTIIAQYQRTTPDEIFNEMHSIFGTEVAVLSVELEAHYRKYFTDRQKIVRYSQQYEATFTEISEQIETYDQQLADLRQRKENLEVLLNNQQARIAQDQEELNNLRTQGQIEAYNAAVPIYNAAVQAYNARLVELKDVVARYNSTVEERNALATTQNDLVQHMDSNYQPIP